MAGSREYKASTTPGPDEIQAPLVHLNGSSAERLTDQLANINLRLVEALNAIREAFPNGRDYYPLQDGALKRATSEWNARINMVEEIQNHLSALYSCIEDQSQARVSRR